LLVCGSELQADRRIAIVISKDFFMPIPPREPTAGYRISRRYLLAEQTDEDNYPDNPCTR
jgi:hypothetical protein